MGEKTRCWLSRSGLEVGIQMACEESEVSVRKSRVNLQLRIQVQQITESAGPESWQGWSMREHGSGQPISVPNFPSIPSHDM